MMLISMRSAAEQAEDVREEMSRRAALNAPLLAPITSEKEKAYTRLIKSRKLYEGACELSWSDYFAFRTVQQLKPLTAADLAYAGQWTSHAAQQSAGPADETDYVRDVRRLQGAARYRGFKLSPMQPVVIDGFERRMYVLRDERTHDTPRPRVFYYATFAALEEHFGTDMADEIAPATSDRVVGEIT